MIIRIFILCLFLASCSTVPTSVNDLPAHYDAGSSSDEEDNHRYLIETNSEALVDFKVRISNSTNDTNCENGPICTQNPVSTIDPAIRHFDFSRKGSPNIA